MKDTWFWETPIDIHVVECLKSKYGPGCVKICSTENKHLTDTESVGI